MNKPLLLYFFLGTTLIYSYESVEYCFIKNFENNECLYLHIQKIPIKAKVKQSDSLECDGVFSLERKDIFNLSENITATYKTYDDRGCLGTGGSISCSLDGTSGLLREFPTVTCPVKTNLDIPVAFPDRFSVCEDNYKEKKSINNFQIKDFLNNDFNVEWQTKIKCPPHYDTTFSGSYSIRITGECPKEAVNTEKLKK